MSRLGSLILGTGGVLALALAVPAGAQQQGIKVHGHWAVEVRNADGSLALRREFENALETSGGTVLVNLLARTHAMGRWQVILGGQNVNCRDESGGPAACRMTEADIASQSPYDFPTLVAAPREADPNTGASELVLQGSFVATVDGDVNEVVTLLVPTGAEVVSGVFTRARLSEPIPVAATQTVSVTVSLTFS